jgi:hypothetical protein
VQIIITLPFVKDSICYYKNKAREQYSCFIPAFLILSKDLDIPADKIIRLYVERWGIEVLFKKYFYPRMILFI